MPRHGGRTTRRPRPYTGRRACRRDIALVIRVKALLEKAPVKEALEIEKEMRRVTDEIELLEGKLKLLKDKS